MMQKIVSLKGSLWEELRFGVRSIFEEKCGLAGVVNLQGASGYAYDILHEEDHRGEDGAGIISIKGESFHQIKRAGSITGKFSEVNLDEELPGKVAIGQNRYTTKGDYKSVSNIPPFLFFKTKFGPFALAHNGTLVDSKNTENKLIQEGAVFQSTTDSELIGHLIAHSNKENLELAIIDALNEITAAYSLLILTPDKLFAIRDRYGIRPLFISKLGNGYLIASENDAPDQYDESVIHLREIEPGEMLIFEKGQETKFRSVKYAEPDEHYCIVEGIYFSSPRSTCHDIFHEDFRQKLGREVFSENPDLKGDFILPVLDSGKHSALGLSKAMGTELYKEYFLRKHRPRKARRRSYTAPTEESRINAVYQKLHLRKDKIRGKRALVVDDTIIRLTTMRVVCKRLRDAGASYITIVIPSPSVTDICPLGMDHQTKSELIAYERSLDEIRKECGADELIYLSLEGLNNVVDRTYKCGVCTGCFGGKYPIKSL